MNYKTETDDTMQTWRHVLIGRRLPYSMVTQTSVIKFAQVTRVSRSHTDSVMVTFDDGIYKSLVDVIATMTAVCPGEWQYISMAFAYGLTI